VYSSLQSLSIEVWPAHESAETSEGGPLWWREILRCSEPDNREGDDVERDRRRLLGRFALGALQNSVAARFQRATDGQTIRVC
jgi:hypothetical protein